MTDSSTGHRQSAHDMASASGSRTWSDHQYPTVAAEALDRMFRDRTALLKAVLARTPAKMVMLSDDDLADAERATLLIEDRSEGIRIELRSEH